MSLRSQAAMWSNLHVSHGNKVSSATIRVDVTEINCTMLLE